jgi:arylsulfatase A-like enzyme
VTLSSNPDLRVDALPERLGARGYARAIFWGSNPDFDNQLAWARGWYDRLEFETPGNRLLYTERVSDRELVDRVISFVEEHDRTEPGRPFLALGSTAGTHFPFTEEDSYYAPLSALGDQSRVDPGDETDPAVRYRRVLGGMDAHFGRLVAALGRRARSDRTVIIVLGDHAFPTGPAGTGAQRALPLDDYVWTSALLIGPESLIGPPRTIDVPTAQTDLLPTILDLIRDPDPYVAVGHSLLGPLPPDREVVSVREGGLRVDRGNWSLYIPTHGPPWADRSLDGVLEPTSPDAAGFSAEDIRAWERRMSTWRWLVSGNRVKREHGRTPWP